MLIGLTVCYLFAIIFMAVRQSIQTRDYLERKMLMAKEDIAVKQYLKAKERDDVIVDMIKSEYNMDAEEVQEYIKV